jgi:hypothetical protein
MGACHPGVVQPLPLALAVDSSAYHRAGQAPVAVPFRVTNTGSGPVYLAQCGGQPLVLVDRLSWGTWRLMEGGFCNGAQEPPVELAPGDTARGLITLYAGGNFRLRIAGAEDPQGSYDRAAASREFDVW